MPLEERTTVYWRIEEPGQGESEKEEALLLAVSVSQFKAVDWERLLRPK
jgi:hypothetical protein